MIAGTGGGEMDVAALVDVVTMTAFAQARLRTARLSANVALLRPAAGRTGYVYAEGSTFAASARLAVAVVAAAAVAAVDGQRVATAGAAVAMAGAAVATAGAAVATAGVVVAMAPGV